MLFVTDGPLRDFEYAFLETLVAMEKRVIVCLNKADWFAARERGLLVEQIAAQVAQLVGVSEKHIQRAIREGKLPCSNIGGQNRPTLRVAHADVVEWMRSTKIDVAATGSVRQSANGNRSARTHPNVPMPQPRIRGR